MSSKGQLIKREDLQEEIENLLAKKKSTAKTKVAQAFDMLTTALEEQYAAESQIKRGGKQIVIPTFMELDDAANAVKSYYEQMEDEVEQVLEFVGHEYELLAACDQGMKNCFGQFFGQSEIVQTFFGNLKVSARSHTIPVGPHENRTVPYGNVTVPGLPVEMKIGVDINKKNPMQSQLGLFAKYKKKYEYLITEMKRHIDEELAKNSVFKGKAIDSQYTFLDLDAFPTDKIVYSKNMQRQLGVHLFGPIKSHDVLDQKKLNIRRSVLLYGTFGTGKTLTAIVAAKFCVDNGWTFMNVSPGDSIENAIQFAEKYQPAMVFFEDIDQVTPRGRTPDVNSILNVVDGFLSKRSKVMIVLTSNHTEKIEQAMLRPGRIDAVLEMGDVDEQVIDGMVKAYCPGMTKDIDAKRLLKSAQGYTQSFISEACHRSVLYAINRDGAEGEEPVITTDDIESALIGLRPQFNLMTKETEKSDVNVHSLIEGLVKSHTKNSEVKLSSQIDNKVAEIIDYLDERL